MDRTIVLIVLLAVAMPSMGQLPPAAQRDLDYTKSLTMEPGGTPEERLWQVLVLMGAGQESPSEWTGSVGVAGGELHVVEGYRFEPPKDRVLPEGGWRLETSVTAVLYSSGLGHGGTQRESRLLPKGVWLRGAGTASTRVTVKTNRGAFSFHPMAMRVGEIQRPLACVEVKRTLPATDLAGTRLRQHDFPSIAAAPDGTVWIAWLSYHDRREELNFRRHRDGEWTRLIPVGRAAEDLWRPHVASDASGKPWLIWSQQVRGNWDIYAMAWEDNEWGRLHRLSDDALPDIEPAVARAPDGAIYVVWQAMRGQFSQVLLRCLRDGKWSETVEVTFGQHNDWLPAVAAGPDGRVWIVWDRYRSSYDVYCRSYSSVSGLSE
jgi:hypothetical protein